MFFYVFFSLQSLLDTFRHGGDWAALKQDKTPQTAEFVNARHEGVKCVAPIQMIESL